MAGSLSQPLFHHVGFVVPSIPAALESFARALQATASEIFYDPAQRVRVAFLSPPGGGPQIELIEPAGERSPVSAFLSRGGGLHHVCYEVPDIPAQLATMRSQKAAVLRSPQPAVAFGGRRIAWVLTREKLLIEYLESSVK